MIYDPKKFEKFSAADKCPARNVLDRFGDKWSVLVLVILGAGGTLRFNAISSTIGDISQKMLTVTLRTLEADGLVKRKVYPEIPPRVEYELTDLGKSLLPVIENLVDWASKNMSVVMKNRKKYAAKKSSAAVNV